MDAMTAPTETLIEYLRKIELELDDDWLRQMVQNFTQAVIEIGCQVLSGEIHSQPTARHF